jgi:hypothetical protein
MRNGQAMEQAQRENATGQSGGTGREIPAPAAVPQDVEATERAISWKIEFIMDDSGEWESDPLRFESPDEALAYVRDLELRWSAVRDWRVIQSLDPANHPRPRAGRNK